MPRLLSWAVLGLLLAGTLVGAATFDRSQWPALVGDEATYLMQAQSLAWDYDLRFERADYDRFVEQWGVAPEGLILQSSDGGATITYAKPVFYSLAIAPFVRLAPTRGPAIGNAVYLTLAALLATMALWHVTRRATPLLVACFVFASITFAHVFWVHADLFLMVLVAVALALAYGSPDEEPGRRGTFRWMVVGAALTAVALSRPLYATLLLPAALSASWQMRRRAWISGLLGALLLGGLVVAINVGVRGVWTSYGGERMGFYSYTGFPTVDFPADAWAEQIESRPGTGSWVGPGKLKYPIDPTLTAWNALYFLAGRNVGLVPYFLPALIGLAAFRPTRGRWALLAAVAVTTLGFFYLRAFNFYGGGGALANRYFIPLYPAFWFMVARPVRAWAPIVVAGLSAPFLWPTWSAPRAFPQAPDGGFRYVSETAQRWLPHETSLSHLKPSGYEDVIHNDLWVKLATNSLAPENDGATLVLEADRRWGDVVIGSPIPVTGLELEVDGSGDPFDVAGAEVAATEQAALGVVYRLSLDRPTARHRMWWTRDDVWLYRIRLTRMTREAPALAFEIRASPADEE